MPEKEQKPIRIENLDQQMDRLEKILGEKEQIRLNSISDCLIKEMNELPLGKIVLELKKNTASDYDVISLENGPEEEVLISFQLKRLLPHRSFKEFDEARKAGIGELKWFLIFTNTGSYFCQLNERCWRCASLNFPLASDVKESLRIKERWPRLLYALLKIPLELNSS